MQIPISNPAATHEAIKMAVTTISNLQGDLRFLLHLHREGQRAFAKKATRPNTNKKRKPGATAIKNRSIQGIVHLKCRSHVMNIPIRSLEETQLGIRYALTEIVNLQEHLRCVLQLHREAQARFGKKAEAQRGRPGHQGCWSSKSELSGHSSVQATPPQTSSWPRSARPSSEVMAGVSHPTFSASIGSGCLRQTLAGLELVAESSHLVRTYDAPARSFGLTTKTKN